MTHPSTTTARPARRRLGALALAVVATLALGACAKENEGSKTPPTSNPDSGPPSAAQIKEAARLVNIGAFKTPPPAAVARCVASQVVQNPLLDQAANDIAQIRNGDLRQAVMFNYLQCGYDYITTSYMRFAPKGLKPKELACIRSKFTQLSVQQFAEVIVLDPDAENTGPLVIQACRSGSKSNPLLKNGSLIDMGGS